MIKRCRQHDRVAQQKLYEKYAPVMLSICMRYVKDYHVACDLMHDGFITVYSKIGDFRSEGSFEGWMRRIFVNTSLGYLRKNNVLSEAVPVESAIQLDNRDTSPSLSLILSNHVLNSFSASDWNSLIFAINSV